MIRKMTGRTESGSESVQTKERRQAADLWQKAGCRKKGENMERAFNILDWNTAENTWLPPEIPEEEMAYEVRNDVNASQSDDYLYIFRTDPYIDSIYIEYDRDRNPVDIRRFAIHEGYVWDPESEDFFHEHCIKSQHCTYPGGQLDRLFDEYRVIHPEWHIKRYRTKGLRLLDHLYNCMKKNTAKEMLYKAGLDELAAHIDELDELNLLASRPSELYDGLTMKVLRSVNCPDGASLLASAKERAFVKELNLKFPDLFEEQLNDAQCRYLKALIKGNLTVGEAGRLLRSRKPDLAKISTRSLFELFMAQERRYMQLKVLFETFGEIDPIYENYLRTTADLKNDDNVRQLEFYLIRHRAEYDRKMRLSNRKRDLSWQEHGKDYIVRFPQTINDFCREAIYMQNCLMAYVDAVINNDTDILFMRRADDVNRPFITMEVYEGHLMQAYHRFNGDCTDEEAAWIRGYFDRHGLSVGRYRFNADVDELF